jgi:Raf kinase inhibitor-like YbhB/YbcL family protein
MELNSARWTPALEDPKDARQGTNTHGTIGYFGPRPPGSDPHHYHFQLFALDAKLALKPGATRKDVLDAMQSHVLTQGELVGVFQKPGS